MPPRIHGSEDPNPVAEQGNPGTVLLRDEHFTLLCNVLGHTTQEAQATFIDMDFRALMRARRGRTCGPKFIAHTLTAFDKHAGRFDELRLPHTFDAIFDVVAPDRVAAS